MQLVRLRFQHLPPLSIVFVTSQLSAADITARLRRIEADKTATPTPAPPPLIAPDGLSLEDYERFYLVAVFTYVRDLALHFLPDSAPTVEKRTNDLLRWLYSRSSGERRADEPGGAR